MDGAISVEKEDLGMDFETENMPKDYPSLVLYVDVLGPTPETVGKLWYGLVMQDGHTKYALTNLIPNVEAGTIADQLLIRQV